MSDDLESSLASLKETQLKLQRAGIYTILEENESSTGERVITLVVAETPEPVAEAQVMLHAMQHVIEEVDPDGSKRCSAAEEIEEDFEDNIGDDARELRQIKQQNALEEAEAMAYVPPSEPDESISPKQMDHLEVLAGLREKD